MKAERAVSKEELPWDFILSVDPVRHILTAKAGLFQLSPASQYNLRRETLTHPD